MLTWVGHGNASHRGCHDHLCRHGLLARHVHRDCLVSSRLGCGPSGDLDVAHHRLACRGCSLSQPHGHERLVRLSARNKGLGIEQADGYFSLLLQHKEDVGPTSIAARETTATFTSTTAPSACSTSFRRCCTRCVALASPWERLIGHFRRWWWLLV